MKIFIIFLMIFNSVLALGQDCQAPSAGILEKRVKETFHGNLAERELKEWMIHPNNTEVRKNIKELDRRIKFTPQRLDREALLVETQARFEQAIRNTGRSNVMEDFPTEQTQSRVTASEGALTIEVTNIDKQDLDVIPKDVLDKIEPKVKVNYYYPYDKYEYLLTYEGKEMLMENALLKVQKDMEDNCAKRNITNTEYKRWYENNVVNTLKPGSNVGGAGGGSKGSTGQ